MKPTLCKSDYIYFVKDDEVYSNRVHFELVIDSPVDKDDLDGLRANEWRRVWLSEGEDLREVSKGHFKPGEWYIVADDRKKSDLAFDMLALGKAYEAHISF